jgi:DNA-binding LacI/PurR family transcriptional regulator
MTGSSAGSLLGRLFLLLCLLPQRVSADDDDPSLTFFLINGGSAFFDPVASGWDKQCADLGVTCLHALRSIPELEGEQSCAYRLRAVQAAVQNQTIDGLILKPCGQAVEDLALIRQVNEEWGIPVVTFDSDRPDAPRIANVGTDNAFLGRTMARLLRQLRPEGGSFAVVAPKSGRYEGFVEELTKDNDREDRAQWVEAIEPRFDVGGSGYYQLMEEYALLNPSALVTMKQTPMRHPNWTGFVDKVSCAPFS